jgi:hypothetical protein
MTNNSSLILNVDYYINSQGDVVFTQKFHLDRGHCCQSGCMHCPYNYKDKVDPNVPAELKDPWDEENFGEEE